MYYLLLQFIYDVMKFFIMICSNDDSVDLQNVMYDDQKQDFCDFIFIVLRNTQN